MGRKFYAFNNRFRTNTGKMTASDYTHLFGYLRSAYNVSKRRK